MMHFCFLFSDISNGREVYPIKMTYNKRGVGLDKPEVPAFHYITKSVLQQTSIQIERRISQLRICLCTDE